MKKNPRWKWLAGIAMMVAVAGCGPKEITRSGEYEDIAGDPGEASVSDLLGEEKAEAPMPPPEVIPVEFSMQERPVDEDGNTATDLDLLNEAYEAAVMWASANLPPMPTNLTLEQEMNWDPGAHAPKIETMDDMVKLGVIKTVPEAPAGKRYAIQGSRVVLIDAQ